MQSAHTLACSIVATGQPGVSSSRPWASKAWISARVSGRTEYAGPVEHADRPSARATAAMLMVFNLKAVIRFPN